MKYSQCAYLLLLLKVTSMLWFYFQFNLHITIDIQPV